MYPSSDVYDEKGNSSSQRIPVGHFVLYIALLLEKTANDGGPRFEYYVQALLKNFNSLFVFPFLYNNFSNSVRSISFRVKQALRS